MIAVIAAEDMELPSLMEALTIKEESTLPAGKIWLCSYEGSDFLVAFSGVGKVHMALTAQALIERYPIDAMIGIGVAGGIAPEVGVGDLVISTDLVQHDMDITALGREPGYIPGIGLSLEADPALINIAKASGDDVAPQVQVHTGRIATGDQFIAGVRRHELYEQFGAMCAEMEGAAMAQVACLNHVPFVVVRAISDNADGDAASDYPTFLASAMEYATPLLLNMIATYSEEKR